MHAENDAVWRIGFTGGVLGAVDDDGMAGRDDVQRWLGVVAGVGAADKEWAGDGGEVVVEISADDFGQKSVGVELLPGEDVGVGAGVVAEGVSGLSNRGNSDVDFQRGADFLVLHVEGLRPDIAVSAESIRGCIGDDIAVVIEGDGRAGELHQARMRSDENVGCAGNPGKIEAFEIDRGVDGGFIDKGGLRPGDHEVVLRGDLDIRALVESVFHVGDLKDIAYGALGVEEPTLDGVAADGPDGGVEVKTQGGDADVIDVKGGNAVEVNGLGPLRMAVDLVLDHDGLVVLDPGHGEGCGLRGAVIGRGGGVSAVCRIDGLITQGLHNRRGKELARFEGFQDGAEAQGGQAFGERVENAHG